jgi:hypothetical protein
MWQCLMCGGGRSPLRGYCSQDEVHEYTVKLVLSTLHGGITLITKLLGGGGWGGVWCVVGVDLHSEGSAVRGRCTSTLFSSCSQQYRKELPSLNCHSGGGCSSVFYEALLIDFCATVTLFLQSNNISRILLQKKSLIFLPTCKVSKGNVEKSDVIF